jgi:hypothetical protein
MLSICFLATVGVSLEVARRFGFWQGLDEKHKFMVYVSPGKQVTRNKISDHVHRHQ